MIDKPFSTHNQPQRHCKGRTLAGERCKVTVGSRYGWRTIADEGYCGQHLDQKHEAKAGLPPRGAGGKWDRQV